MSNFFEETMQGLLEAVEIESSEIPKHRKKRKSSTSKSSNKSKHKHEYIECLFVENGYPHRGTYCSICGKIGDIHFFETEKTDNGYYRQLDYDEIFDMYKHLDQVEIEDIFQRFVPITDSRE